MAAVAGAVADEVLAAMTRGRRLAARLCQQRRRHRAALAPGERFASAWSTARTRRAWLGTRDVRACDPCAASRPRAGAGAASRSASPTRSPCWRATAARADAAATMVANAVDLPGHPAIARAPAGEIDPDSDLGDRLVTVDVGALARDEIDRRSRSRRAPRRRSLRDAGLIEARRCASAGGHGLSARGASRYSLTRAAIRNEEMAACRRLKIRKRVIIVEEIFHEGGPVAPKPYRRARDLAVIHNPFAGRYVEDIVGFSED